jgi:uroporphyrinogen decarboxylase
MTDRQRFLNVLNYKPTDRAVYRGIFGAWPETVERWKSEGYDPSHPSPFPAGDQWAWVGHWFFPNPPFERKVIEENDRTVLYINPEGILMRERKDNPSSSMPQFVKFPVESRQDFRRFYRERMQPDLAARIGKDYIKTLADFRNRDFPLIVISDRWGGFFGGLRGLVGVHRLCTLFYDDPALVEEMMDAVADFIIAMMSQILDHTDIDVYGFWEDMAYKTGPLLSPAMLRKFALPRYRRVVESLRSRGVQFFSLDSDGDISSLIPVWLDAGINLLYPFEVQAGMDVLQVRKQYGRDLRMWFGLDKRAVAAGPKAIDAELARVRPLLEEGGYVAGTDHSLPPDVPFTHYCYYMDALWKLCQDAPVRSP